MEFNPDLYSVTVIMNVYNENPIFLFQAIESYLNQINVKIQIIISTIENDPCIKLINDKYNNIEFCISNIKEHPGYGHKGIYYQLNKSIHQIKNYWYSYASSNDVALTDKLYNEITKCLKMDKRICYSSFYLTDQKLNIIQLLNFHDYDFNKHLKGNFVNDCALIESKLLIEMMPFNSELYSNHAYWDLWLRIYKKYGNVFIYNPIPTFYYRKHNNALHIDTAKNNIKKNINNHYREILLSHHTTS